MIKEAYVSFEVAKLLKEKGFDEPCRSYFINDEGDYRRCTVEITNKDCTAEQILRPTHQMAMAWLREKGIYIQIRRNINTYLYGAIMLKDGTEIYSTIPSELETYEKAVEAALKYSLEN